LGRSDGQRIVVAFDMRFVLALLLLPAFNATAQQAQPAQSPSHRVEHQENSNSDKDNAGGVVQPLADEGRGNVVSLVEKNCSEQNDERGKKPSYWDKVISPEVLPIWIASIVAIIGIVVAVCTLKAIRDEAKEIRSVAEAARDNAAAQINAERPWVSASIRKTVKSIRQPNKTAFEDASYFHFVLTNHGRTPAEIYAMDGEPKLTDQGIDGGLSHEPDYSPNILKHVKLLAPNEEWMVEDVNLQTWHYSDSDKEGIRTDHLHVIFVGVVLYRDQFKRDVQRETRFCYTYMQGLGDYRPSGPPQYTKYT